MTIEGFFITGTDTGVGKTFAGAALTRLLFEKGLDVQPRKPVESGCSRGPNGLVPEDGLAYQRAVDGRVPLTTITPYRFEPAISPERAVHLAGRILRTDDLLRAVNRDAGADSIRMVEGAGGFYSPLCTGGLNAHLAEALGLPVLLVAADRLGCLNHILLTREAIHSRSLTLAAVILNRQAPNLDEAADNLSDLRKLIPEPVLALDHAPSAGALRAQLAPIVDF